MGKMRGLVFWIAVEKELNRDRSEGVGIRRKV